jgi:hypothetical protein
MHFFERESEAGREIPLLLAPSDKIKPSNVFGRIFYLKIPRRTEWLGPVSVFQYHLQSIILYRYRVGAGVYSELPCTIAQCIDCIAIAMLVLLAGALYLY